MRRHPSIQPASLAARPATPSSIVAPGVHRLNLDGKRDGLIVIPGRLTAEQPSALILALHGAGGDGHSMLHLLRDVAEERNCVVLLPDARKHTWDFLIDDFGPDVSFIDRALHQTFEQCWIDPSRLAIAGFSDGASYALTLGLANGDLFTHVIAFSPGFMRPPAVSGSPGIFLSHGTEDAVLPIERCSRRLVPQLQRAGYDVIYREFAGPHTVPGTVLTESMEWFLQER